MRIKGRNVPASRRWLHLSSRWAVRPGLSFASPHPWSWLSRWPRTAGSTRRRRSSARRCERSPIDPRPISCSRRSS